MSIVHAAPALGNTHTIGLRWSMATLPYYTSVNYDLPFSLLAFSFFENATKMPKNRPRTVKLVRV